MDKINTKELIFELANMVESSYIDPTVGMEIKASLLENYEKGLYSDYMDLEAFSNKLTSDIYSLCKDMHFKVCVKSSNEKGEKSEAPNSIKFIDINYGFTEIKILDENIAYINLKRFCNVEYASNVAISAMELVSRSKALIFDLRDNRGGHPSMVQLISSYLFDTKPIHLNSIYWRKNNKVDQFWTLPYIPGKRLPNIPVYILIGPGTFSAAEEFCFNLQALKRATLIGSTTAGAAHPSEVFSLNDCLSIYIPIGKPVNPILEKNWEGCGVCPDIETSPTQAFEHAYNLAKGHTDKYYYR